MLCQQPNLDSCMVCKVTTSNLDTPCLRSKVIPTNYSRGELSKQSFDPLFIQRRLQKIKDPDHFAGAPTSQGCTLSNSTLSHALFTSKQGILLPELVVVIRVFCCHTRAEHADQAHILTGDGEQHFSRKKSL